MNMLEDLGVRTRGLVETVTPFETWEGSEVREWQVTMQLLNMRDMVDISKVTGNVSSLELAYLTKIHLLAKSIKAINGFEVATAEDVEEYNKRHNLAGNTLITSYEYKVLFIEQLSEVIVSRLTYMYDQLSNTYVAKLLGKSVIPDELDATKFNENSSDAAAAGEEEEQILDDSPDTSTTT